MPNKASPKPTRKPDSKRATNDKATTPSVVQSPFSEMGAEDESASEAKRSKDKAAPPKRQ